MFSKILIFAILAAYVQAQGHGHQQANSYISYSSSSSSLGGHHGGSGGASSSGSSGGHGGSSYISYSQGSSSGSAPSLGGTSGGHGGSSYISYSQGSSSGSVPSLGGTSGGHGGSSYISYSQGGSSGLSHGIGHAVPVLVKSVPIQSHHHEEPHAPAKYQFKYGVQDKHSGDIKQQEETRDGDVVKGWYSLHEPDGTILTVHYTATKKDGFNAVVQRQGHASHPQHSSHH